MGEDSGREHFGGIPKEQIVGSRILDQVAKLPVLDRLAGTMDYEQPGFIPNRKGFLGDPFGWQFVVKEGGIHLKARECFTPQLRVERLLMVPILKRPNRGD